MESRSLLSIVEGLTKTGMTEKVHELALSIKVQNGRDEALEVVGKAVVKSGKALEAYEAAEEISEDNSSKRYAIVEELVKHLAAIGRLDEAVETAQTHFDAVWKVQLLCEIISIAKSKNITDEKGVYHTHELTCTACGTKNRENNNYCTKCGAKLN
jgi:hypothetical protein